MNLTCKCINLLYKYNIHCIIDIHDIYVAVILQFIKNENMELYKGLEKRFTTFSHSIVYTICKTGSDGIGNVVLHI